MKTLSEKPIEIFTDGSCVNYADKGQRAKRGHAGWAIVVIWGDDANQYRSGYLAPPQTNQTAELYAVLNALKFIKDNRLQNQRVMIVSDSKYAINGMTSQFIHQAAQDGFDTVPNGRVWKEMHELAEGLPRVRYRHVRGHRGNKYNEMADRMASFARRTRKG
jgi:ribonuclease HI